MLFDRVAIENQPFRGYFRQNIGVATTSTV